MLGPYIIYKHDGVGNLSVKLENYTSSIIIKIRYKNKIASGT